MKKMISGFFKMVRGSWMVVLFLAQPLWDHSEVPRSEHFSSRSLASLTAENSCRRKLSISFQSLENADPAGSEIVRTNLARIDKIIEENRPDKAIIELGILIELTQVRQPIYIEYLAKLFEKTGDFSKAFETYVDLYNAADKPNLETAAAIYRTGRKAARYVETFEALSALREEFSAETAKTQISEWILKTQEKMYAGQSTEESEAFFRSQVVAMIQNFDANQPPRNKSSYAAKIARRLIKLNDLEPALLYAEMALHFDSSSADAIETLISVYVAKKKWNLARRLLEDKRPLLQPIEYRNLSIQIETARVKMRNRQIQ